MAKKPPALEPISTDERYAAASAVLEVLTAGLQRIELDISWLRVSDHLSRQPSDQRAMQVRDTLARRRKDAPEKPAEPKGGHPKSVVEALGLLREGKRSVPSGRKALLAEIEQLETDRDLVGRALIEQNTVIAQLRDELSAAVASRIAAQHRALVLEQYRALQQLAATTDAERAFRREFTNAGYIWRADLLPAPVLRSALCAGSESDFDSEASRTRRMLEEMKLI